MQLSHRIELKPSPEQAEYFARACGTARFVWNWALAEWNRLYTAGQKPKAITLKKQFNAIKYATYPWLKDIHRDAHAQPFTYLGRAWAKFFRDIRAGQRSYAPKFKKKDKCRDSFYVANDKFSITGQTVRLPLVGQMAMTEALRFEGKILGATVSRTAQRWFISIQVEVPEHVFHCQRSGNGIVGADLGVKTAVTLSDGRTFTAPKPLKSSLRRLRIRGRRLSHKIEVAKRELKSFHGPHQLGRQSLPLSQRRLQFSQALARLHARIARTRVDWTHKLTTHLCRENQTVVIEDLNVKGMLANDKLARAISDVGFGEFRRQLEYKAKRYGAKLILADRWYPSSKLCSCCGWRYEALTLNEREWTCHACDKVHDRDLNAAINLKRLATGTALPVASRPVTEDTAAGIVPAAVGKVTSVRYEAAQSGDSGREEIVRNHFRALF